MTQVIDFSNVESAFINRYSDITVDGVKVTSQRVLEIITDFFSAFKIKNVDYTMAYNDMLLFEYGYYEHEVTGEPYFLVEFTRQFALNSPEQEMYHLRFILYYDLNLFKDLGEDALWSSEFSEIADWADELKKRPAYITTHMNSAHTHEVYFGQI